MAACALQVMDSHDRVTLMTILASFYNPQLVDTPSYSLAATTTDGYTAPAHTDLKVASVCVMHTVLTALWFLLLARVWVQPAPQRRHPGCSAPSAALCKTCCLLSSSTTLVSALTRLLNLRLLPQGYLDYINALPHSAPPGVFGLHDNADIAKDLSEAQQLLDGLLLSQATSTTSTATTSTHNARASCKGSPADAALHDTTSAAAAAAGVGGSGEEGAGVGGAAAAVDGSQAADAAAAAVVQVAHTPPAASVKSREDVIAEIAADILAQLPPVFDLEAAEAAYPQDYFNSVNTVLVQVRGGGGGLSGLWMPLSPAPACLSRICVDSTRSCLLTGTQERTGLHSGEWS